MFCNGVGKIESFRERLRSILCVGFSSEHGGAEVDLLGPVAARHSRPQGYPEAV